MNNYTEEVPYPWDTYLQYSDGRLVPTGSYSGTGLFASVSSSPIVHGDHVHPNAHSYTINRQTPMNGRILSGNPSRTRTLKVGLLNSANKDTVYVPPYSMGPMYERALDSLNEKVRGGLDLSVDAFQARQTKRMFDAASRVEDYARLARKRGRGVTRLVAGAWLELQYGWRPLLGTIHDAGDKLMRYQQRRMRFSAAAFDNFHGQYINHKFLLGTGIEVRGTPKGRYGYKLGIALSPGESAMQALGQYSSLNPVSIAWELLPYSFVVDWFVDVGGYVRNFETALLYKSAFRFGYATGLVACDAEEVAVSTSPNVTVQGSRKTRYIHFVRALMSEYPFPRYPRITCHLGSERLLNGAALLGNLLR